MKKGALLIFTLCFSMISFATHTYGFYPMDKSEVKKDSSEINFYELQKLEIYPNPASENLYIDYDILFVKEAKLQIYNSIGSIVLNKTLVDKKDKLKIRVNELENGVYFCTLKIDGNLLNTKKILINH